MPWTWPWVCFFSCLRLGCNITPHNKKKKNIYRQWPLLVHGCWCFKNPANQWMGGFFLHLGCQGWWMVEFRILPFPNRTFLRFQVVEHEIVLPIEVVEGDGKLMRLKGASQNATGWNLGDGFVDAKKLWECLMSEFLEHVLFSTSSWTMLTFFFT